LALPLIYSFSLFLQIFFKGKTGIRARQSKRRAKYFIQREPLEFHCRFNIFNSKQKDEMTEVAVGILRKEGKILICQRKKGGRYELKWEFPGGKLESGETIEQCLRREMHEELAIEIDCIERIQTQAAYYEDGGMFNVSYCSISGFNGEPQNNVFEQFRWVTLDELKHMDLLDGNKLFVANLLQ
jgi:8-oxo-dGTP diphosphatase